MPRSPPRCGSAPSWPRVFQGTSVRSPLTGEAGPCMKRRRSDRTLVTSRISTSPIANTYASAAEEAHLVRLRLALLDQRLRLRNGLREQVRDLAEVLPQLLRDPWRAQAGGRMEERQQVDEAPADQVLLRDSADLGDPGLVGRQQLGREVPERADHAGLDQPDLLLEIWPARIDLLGLRIAVAGRPALEDVGEKDVLALQPDVLEQLGEESACPADEGQALAILLRAGRLADEDQVGVGVARPEDDPGAGRRQRAALADRGLVVDLDQRLAACLGVAHEPRPPRRRAARFSAARCCLTRSLAPPRSVPRLSSRRRRWFGVSCRCSGAYEVESSRSVLADPHSGQANSAASTPTCEPTS